jgi:glycosyltransferase involved in cell wall biosynthesis
MSAKLQISVSVIIPVYNRFLYIESAIDSVFRQEYKNFELIVVDDGSVDGSFELLERLQDKFRFKLLSHSDRENKGQSASINRGIEEASGSYIAILDSDDEFWEDKLDWQVQFLECNAGFGMVYGQGHAVDAEKHFLYTVPDEFHVEVSDPNDLLLDCHMALPGGSLIRKSVFDGVGLFEESFRAGQDHDMALRIMEVYDVAYVPRPAFYYRKHEDAISTKGLERRWVTGMEILRRASQRYPYKKLVMRKRKAVLNFRLGQTLWCESSKIRAIKHFLMAGILDPFRAFRVLKGTEPVR